jgi:N-acetylmuramic acid 6-phosphate etherase
MHWTGLDQEAGKELLAAHLGNLRQAVTSYNQDHNSGVGK